MHLLLTDRLCCPRCGPEFGLILLAREMRDRRIIEGELGCSNCRVYYPVRGGVGDLRSPPRRALEDLADELPATDAEDAVRFGALLGVTSGPGTLLLMGPAARSAGPLADRLDGVEVVAADPALLGDPEREGVSRIVLDRRIPFFHDSLRGVLLSGEGRETLVGEAARVVARLGRVVITEAPRGLRQKLEGLGLTILLAEEEVLVAGKEGPKTVPLTTLRLP